jgi:hypothetical protein
MACSNPVPITVPEMRAMFFNTGMGDGPVALLFARPRHCSPGITKQKNERDVELTTRNGTYAHDSRTTLNCLRLMQQRLVAAMFGGRTENAKAGSR